ncbi:hypothetical protein [Cytobacillus praedii]|uniref:hypothetical protein n=1 Tax=Cytobacillus praedii TaxID=1742358 RepID=UPI003AF52BBF
MKKKTLKYTIFGITSFFLILYGFYYLIIRGGQGEFSKYDKGVTIEVKNSSEHNISNLNFSFGHLDDINFQRLGEIKQLQPGKTFKLTSKSINPSNADLSVYMQYHLKDGDTRIENSIGYFDIKYPNKVVVLVDITKVDDEGNLFLNYKGYNSFTQYYGQIDPDRDN